MGGNATTRYSWQDDTANRASDYLFYNIPESNAHPENLPNGSAADVFVDQTRAAGGEALITVPLIGWTPVDRNYRWGFSIAKYGAQQQNECTINPFQGCNADAGNGVRPDGTTPVTGNDPHDTSRAIDPSFVTGWMAHLAARTGTAAQGRRPALRSRQRAGALEQLAPGHPSGGHDLRRALAEDPRYHRRDQGPGPRRPHPRAGLLGLVRVLLLGGGRLLSRRGSGGPR